MQSTDPERKSDAAQCESEQAKQTPAVVLDQNGWAHIRDAIDKALALTETGPVVVITDKSVAEKAPAGLGAKVVVWKEEWLGKPGLANLLPGLRHKAVIVSGNSLHSFYNGEVSSRHLAIRHIIFFGLDWMLAECLKSPQTRAGFPTTSAPFDGWLSLMERLSRRASSRSVLKLVPNDSPLVTTKHWSLYLRQLEGGAKDEDTIEKLRRQVKEDFLKWLRSAVDLSSQSKDPAYQQRLSPDATPDDSKPRDPLALHKCCASGDSDGLAALLKQPPPWNFSTVDSDGLTAAHVACKHGWSDCLALIFQAAAANRSRVPVKVGDGPSLLEIACEYGQEDVCKLLLSDKVGEVDGIVREEVILRMASGTSTGTTDVATERIVKLLLQHRRCKVSTKLIRSLVQMLPSGPSLNTHAVKVLRAVGPYSSNAKEGDALLEAIKLGHNPAVQVLSDVCRSHDVLLKCLEDCIIKSDQACLVALLRGASIDTWPELLFEALDLLVQVYANYALETETAPTNSSDESPETTSATPENPDGTSGTITTAGASANGQQPPSVPMIPPETSIKLFRAVLEVAMVRIARAPVVMTYPANPPNPNDTRNIAGMKDAMAAVANALPMVEVMENAGEVLDRMGMPWACEFLSPDLVQLFLEFGATWKPSESASAPGLVMGIGGSTALPSDYAYAPIHVCAMSTTHPPKWRSEGKQIKCVELLLNAGCPVDLRTGPADHRRTPLMEAALANDGALVEFLLSRGADIAATDALGHTAAHIAAISASDSALQALIKHDSERVIAMLAMPVKSGASAADELIRGLSDGIAQSTALTTASESKKKKEKCTPAKPCENCQNQQYNAIKEGHIPLHVMRFITQYLVCMDVLLQNNVPLSTELVNQVESILRTVSESYTTQPDHDIEFFKKYGLPLLEPGLWKRLQAWMEEHQSERDQRELEEKKAAQTDAIQKLAEALEGDNAEAVSKAMAQAKKVGAPVPPTAEDRVTHLKKKAQVSKILQSALKGDDITAIEAAIKAAKECNLDSEVKEAERSVELTRSRRKAHEAVRSSDESEFQDATAALLELGLDDEVEALIQEFARFERARELQANMESAIKDKAIPELDSAIKELTDLKLSDSDVNKQLATGRKALKEMTLSFERDLTKYERRRERSKIVGWISRARELFADSTRPLKGVATYERVAMESVNALLAEAAASKALGDSAPTPKITREHVLKELAEVEKECVVVGVSSEFVSSAREKFLQSTPSIVIPSLSPASATNGVSSPTVATNGTSNPSKKKKKKKTSQGKPGDVAALQNASDDDPQSS